MTVNFLIGCGIVYAVCSIAEPILQKYLTLDSGSWVRRLLLASVGIIKFFILLTVLVRYFDPLLRDLKSNDFRINSLSAFTMVLWVQQMIDCISGILSSQLKAG